MGEIIIFLMVLVVLSYSILPTLYFKGIRALPYKEPKGEKFIYLTFDDGPSEEYTNRLLDLLKKYHVKASFFVVAEFAKNNPDIIERMKSEGHTLGLHSLEHKNALWQSASYTREDFDKSISIMDDLKVDVKFFRPPWGHFNVWTLINIKRFGFQTVLWHVMAEDWSAGATVEMIKEKLIRRTKKGQIICLHDGRGKNGAPGRTIKALEEVIPYWIEEGYQFLKVDEMYE